MLSKNMAVGNFSLAVGFCSGNSDDIKNIWESADSRMYAKKADYYKAKAENTM